uniref:cubilin n=1 Tax=Pristiophorus japonicus TaxID=55135 RepID=UPI00398F64EE
MTYSRLSIWLLIVICIFSTLKCASENDGNNRQKRGITSDQPRMTSTNGNLIFQTGNLKNIEFKTSSSGRIKLNNDDLEELFSQIRKNKDDIVELKTNGGHIPQNVYNQISQLNARLIDLEATVQNIQTILQRRPCTSNPCQNDGMCLDLIDAFFCLCPNNWKGLTCSDDINECQTFAGSPLACQNGATCVNTEGSYSCICTPEWYGPHCISKYDDCQRGSQALCEHGICIDLDRVQPNQPKYQCICDVGWAQPPTSPACSSDIDECSLPAHPCSINPPVQCFNSLGSYSCGQCPAGYQGDGKECTQIDVCSTNNGGCHHLASCIFNPGNNLLVCSCPPDYAGNGYGPDGCIPLSDVCQHHHPCVNGHCFTMISSYVCVCDPGWIGTNCTQNINECASIPCQNDGICTDGVNSYSCTCTTDWTGPQCQIPQQADPGCGGTYGDSEGILSSPNWPNPYPSSRQCIYIIRQPTGERIHLHFRHMELESQNSCSSDSIEVRDGDAETDPLIGKFCGSTPPAPITTSGNKLWLKFKADASASKGGFLAVYEVACGGTLNGNGVIQSPYYPNSYPHDKTCEWVINQPEGQVVTLNFISFDIENATNCNHDYVEVKDGAVVDSPLIGKYCGTIIPPIVQSVQRSMYIKFKTDSKMANNGFQATYGSAEKGCGEVLTQSVGNITSPGHPTDYPHGGKCIWYISVQPGYVIRLTFTSFNIEYHMNCSKDYVEVYDNGTISSDRPIGRYCGRSIPPSITSRGNMMSLLFVSDSSIATEGFSASYDSLDASSVCREEFFQSTGTFTSPNYPNGYSNNQECIYTITVENNKQIMLNFTDFKLKGCQTCTSGSVEIRNGGYETSPLVGQYCGTKAPPLILSHSNRLWIKFKSNNIFQYHAFVARWDGTSTGCGATLTTSTGSFTSPNYPMPYSHNAECYWLIQTSAGSIIGLQFEQFHLDSSTGCSYDYLAVYNGNNINSQLLARLCGNQMPAPILSSRNNMYIKLRTDSSVTAGGFFAKYTHICQGVIISNHSQGVLESTSFPQPYPSNQDCHWTIQATAGNTINYTFTAFSLNFNNLVWLKLYDGPSAQSRLIDTFCGNTLPPAGRTSASSLHVAFHSDSSFSGNGFQMLWFQNGCGGELLGPKGEFSSPGYPNRYPHNRECIWFIQGDSGHSIELTIHEFDVEYHQTCNFDVLEVYGGPDITSVRLAQLCSTRSPNNPLVVSSTGNDITIRFKTNSNGNGRGFNATWQQRAGGCGGIFIAPKGEIHSPNYPSPYGNNVDCSWVITVDDHYRILLDFTDFDLEHHQSCHSDYVAVYDGLDEAAPMLGKLCGGLIPGGITSTHNVVYVHFRSQRSIEHRGFRAQFNQACGSSIVTDDIGGAITSPLYPNNYSNNQNCSWIIRAQKPFNHVTVSFTDFAIENRGADCSADALQFLDGDNYGAPSVGRYCGNAMPHPITSFSDVLFVNFISNNVSSFKGFRVTYAASTSACGGMYHMETGAFNSPNYPDVSPPNYECVWYIISSPGNRVQLSFITFDIAYSTNCALDYLEIRDGSAAGQLLGHFCGSTLPANYTSIMGHILWVKFVSDAAPAGVRFRATFSHLYGNEIVGVQGQITSPLWPLHYPHNANYHWTITVPAFYIIRARILELDIDALHRCRFDKLTLYDGPNVHARLIGIYCDFELPPAVLSTGSTLTVQFISDSTINGKGFLLEWCAVEYIVDPTAIATVQPGSCGGVVVTGDSPTFLFSPGWPNNYGTHLDCAWIIRAPQSTVELNILHLDIEPDRFCNYDKLVIRDGDNRLSPLLATLCGRVLPGPLRSTGDAMFIRFTTDEFTNAGGFNASYHKTCGGWLHADHGVITSPNYPRTYAPNLNCTWRVVVTSGFIVAIHFKQPFQVQGSGTDCTSGDYLELKNGPDASSPPLTSHGGNGHYCGGNPPSTMHTTDNQLFVHFISDGNNEGQGFKFSYDASNLACGGTIFVSDSDPVGYIASMSYPNNYPENIDCIWTITVPNGEAVQLDFDDLFYIETHPACKYDYLELHDGATSNAPLIGRFCGSARPSRQKSTGTVMYVRFRTDTHLNHAGFKVKYSIAVCGGMVSAEFGSLQSPGYPSPYPDNSQCEWFLKGPTGHYLTISFQAFNLENTPECIKDFVEIREYNASGRVLGRHCGSILPGSMDTSGSLAYIHFSSDASVNGSGFRLQFEASIEECGGELTADTGTISSPNYPNHYPDSRECQWRITVQVGRRVTLTFNDLRLKAHQHCNYDYVAIYNGLQPNSPRLQKYCGIVDTGTQVMSSGNTMRVVFVTDVSVSDGGFSATYTSEKDAVCGGTLMDLNGGNFSSPGFDGVLNYTNNLNCEWVIQNSHAANSSIYIQFTSFHLEHHPACQWDYIELRFGDPNGDVITRLCGQSATTIPLVIPFPQIWVHFLSDPLVEDIGFFAKYSFTECGGIQTGENGFISSPNYPSQYNPLTHCAWLLEAPEGHTITLKFIYFDLEAHLTCGWDSVTIMNGGSFSSSIIGQYCGTTSPETIKSGSSKLFITFSSNRSVQRGGFYATWMSDSAGCGGIVHADSGSFKSPNWPQNFPDNSECTWKIIAHESKHLEITFDENFQIPNSTNNCGKSYVKVWGGAAETDETLLTTACGNTPPGPITAPANVVAVRFQSEGSVGRGFSASFTNRCGANFTASAGRVMSPNYPNRYDSNLNCQYLINASSQLIVILQFEIFNIQGHSTCVDDNLKIYSGTTASGTPVATLCGSAIPRPISTYGPMLLAFNTDSIGTQTGFVANYHLASCGGTFQGSSGTVTSPADSRTEYNNINCTYHIIVGENRTVKLKFNEFDLETSSACISNYVAVYDGSNTLAPLLGQFCGTTVPPVLRSTNNSIFFEFKTTSFNIYGGWRASYVETLGSNQGCGGYLTGTSGTFSSPDVDFNGKYEKNLDCLWYIFVPLNKIINMTFTVFLLEDTPNEVCTSDSVSIYDGENINSPLVGTYCGSQLPPPFVSSSNFLTVRFISGFSVELAGFNVTYIANNLLCGGIFNATNTPQTITSPGYPSDYPLLTTCHWTIDAPAQKQIRVTVQQFNLPANPNCTLDYLEIKDWPASDFGQIHRFCGSNLTAPDFYSYGRSIKVDFISKVYQSGNKFQLMYEIAGCSRQYNQSFGYLKSPGWPNIYPHNLDCIIILRAPESHKISLFFDAFDIEGLGGCNNDYLEIRNGTDSDGKVLGRFCGTTLPNPIFPNFHALTLYFKSDVPTNRNGFEITWTSSPNDCGGTLLGSSGSFYSPKYPATYDNNTDCEWIIVAPIGRLVTINFIFFNIIDPGGCIKNYLQLYDGPDSSSPPIGPYCGAESNIAPFTSASYHVFVKFHAEYAVIPSGFRITWTS